MKTPLQLQQWKVNGGLLGHVIVFIWPFSCVVVLLLWQSFSASCEADRKLPLLINRQPSNHYMLPKEQEDAYHGIHPYKLNIRNWLAVAPWGQGLQIVLAQSWDHIPELWNLEITQMLCINDLCNLKVAVQLWDWHTISGFWECTVQSQDFANS